MARLPPIISLESSIHANLVKDSSNREVQKAGSQNNGYWTAYSKTDLLTDQQELLRQVGALPITGRRVCHDDEKYF
jgi:hypothetical protein